MTYDVLVVDRPPDLRVPSLDSFLKLEARLAAVEEQLKSVSRPQTWLTLGEAASYCGMSRSTFYKRYRREIPFTRVGTKPMFRAAELDGWMEGRVSSFPSTSNGRAPLHNGPAPGTRRLSPDAEQV